MPIVALEFITTFFSAGYVKRSLKLRCSDCLEFIAQEPDPAVADDTTLISVKNRGGLMTPNSAMVELCKAAEKSIRSIDKLDTHAIKHVKAHTLTYVLLNNIHTKFTCAIHSTELIKTIINRYALIRIKYETTKMIPKQDNMRQKLSRLVVFSHI